ncbi:hypothetical protein [Paraburkholderia phenoliruptrix]|uniref:hypothetical protein n=1 Tax=Paraburkholderia phenoliruptrix TaxID=252970 RepID=UPI0034CE9E86
MTTKTKGTLKAVPRAAWSPMTGRAFAQVGPHWVICCDPGADIAADALDAAELARRWNAYPILIAALNRITANPRAVSAILATATDTLEILKGAA